eukprot:TRINITY_DN84545_c0_g1_i1.p1 TRINITY_DN84545_c0_g1~~TRINITY_DN84545_c0_g1_i1.p1  ORF type:complete len:379 (+),score=28.57 TRINITY_DN84545_c0_g1_i1:107-1243(+)
MVVGHFQDLVAHGPAPAAAAVEAGASLGPAGSVSTAVLFGLLCGLLQMLGPDHLCTLMSLSTSLQAQAALGIGAAWGMAHCSGTVLVCVLLQALRARGWVNGESWEHYGDYVVGGSLVLVSIYFALRESQFLSEDSEGNVTVHSCDCHGGAAHEHLTAQHAQHGHGDEEEGAAGSTLSRRIPPPRARASVRFSRDSSTPGGTRRLSLSAAGRLCAAFSESTSDKPGHSKSRHGGKPSFEHDPLLEDAASASHLAGHSAKEGASTKARVWVGSAALGLLQGLCCPMALVGSTFAAYVPTFGTMAVFIAVYMIVSIIGSGFLAFAWSSLMSMAVGKWVSPRVVYRGSCLCTLIFGVVWIAMNRFQMLEAIEIPVGVDHKL